MEPYEVLVAAQMQPKNFQEWLVSLVVADSGKALTWNAVNNK
jgi:hypothetical protein